MYLGPAATREHAKIDLVIRSLFNHYCAHPEEIPASIPDGELARRVTDYLAGMTDRFCIRAVRDAERPCGVRAVTRYTADSRDRVFDAVDMLALVTTRTDLRRAGVNSYFGLCPFHDERTGSFHVRPEEKHYHCFGCQSSGDPFTFVMETEGLDFKAALESLGRPLRRHARDRGRGPGVRAHAASAGSGCIRCLGARRPTTPATCGSPTRRRARATTCSAAV